jgi:glycerol-3-phosphate dehydrogenase
MQREKIIESIKANPKVDVLVVGAGINGAGTFRDLALNGVNVLLVDRGDFCSGTSATSSHMAHGGIRYLENGEFRLVREAVAERNRMIENAPHLVQPLPTVIPIFKIFSGLLNAPLKFLNWLDRPSERGALVIKIGLIFYDSFTHKQKTVPRHKFYSRDEALKNYPHLNSKIKYAALYYDGQLLSPERMTVEVILDGEDEGEHAKALNYAALTGFNGIQAIIRDGVTGEELIVYPKVVINAAGPWVDDVNEKIGFSDKMIGGTKGSHLVIKNDLLREAVGVSEFFFENKDGRIVLLLPFFDRVIVGTSDLTIENPDDARCTKEEEDYFLDLIKRVFPTIPVTRDQIVFRFSGVRPLEYMKAKTTGQITRDHSMKLNEVGSVPVISLVGGKWTSFRAFSEQATDETFKRLNIHRKSSTASLPLRGGANFPISEDEKEKFVHSLVEKTGLSADYISALFERYGTRASQISDYVTKSNGHFLSSIENWHSAEVKFLIETEKPIHLDDFFLRRSILGWLGKVKPLMIEEFSKIMGDSCNWSQSKRHEEIEYLKKVFLEYYGVSL